MLGVKYLVALCNEGNITTFKHFNEIKLAGADEYALYRYIKDFAIKYNQLPSVDQIKEDRGVDIIIQPLAYLTDKVDCRFIQNKSSDFIRNFASTIKEYESPLILKNQIRSLYIASTIVGSTVSELHELASVANEARINIYNNRNRGNYTGIGSGWSFLDNLLDGYQKGDINTFVARPGVGKTYLMLYQAIHAALSIDEITGKPYKVLFTSMEMTKIQLVYRLLAMVSGTNPSCIIKGQLSSKVQSKVNRYLSGFEEIDEEGNIVDSFIGLDNIHNFHFLEGNLSKSIEDVASAIDELDPDIVFIDGVYLLKPTNSNAGRFEKAAILMDELKSTALLKKVPIIISTQLNRTAKKGGKEASLENIGYSDTIGTHSSSVIAIQFGRMVSTTTTTVRYGRRNEERDYSFECPPLIEINENLVIHDSSPYRVFNILKNREGILGKYAVNFSLTPFDFSEVSIKIATGEGEATSSEYGQPATSFR